MNSLVSNITSDDLRKAAAIRDRIDELQAELAQILGSSSAAVSGFSVKPRGRGRPRKSDLVQRVATTNVGKKQRVMSPAHRAKIAAAAKLRWKKSKAAGKNHL
jgi:hypothetical protein